MSEAAREMSLREWVETLPSVHRAHRELQGMELALRNISGAGDTLSPQELINVCADALGVDRHDYAGEVPAHRSLVEVWNAIKRLSLAAAPIAAAFREQHTEVTPEQYDGFLSALAWLDTMRGVAPPATPAEPA